MGDSKTTFSDHLNIFNRPLDLSFFLQPRRDHFADTPSPCLLKRLLKVEGTQPRRDLPREKAEIVSLVAWQGLPIPCARG